MPAPLLELRGVVKRYDGRTVLDGIDLIAERGETLVIIGGSGSGKSTLARLVVGLEPPTSGSILLDGVDLASLDEEQRMGAHQRFGMVFQSHALLDSMTVFDNVAFPLRERTHLSEDKIEASVMEKLEALDVAAARERLPAELSGGMAKRVGIARAMIMSPEILIYDEPTSGLDPVTSRMVDDLVEDMRERFAVTSLVITHDMASAYAVADRVLLLDHGKIAADAAPTELFELEDPRVRAFTSSSGIDPVRLAHRAHKPLAAIRQRWDEVHAKHEELPMRTFWAARPARS